jgi:hypothetical protein
MKPAQDASYFCSLAEEAARLNEADQQSEAFGRQEVGEIRCVQGSCFLSVEPVSPGSSSPNVPAGPRNSDRGSLGKYPVPGSAGNFMTVRKKEKEGIFNSSIDPM